MGERLLDPPLVSTGHSVVVLVEVDGVGVTLANLIEVEPEAA